MTSLRSPFFTTTLLLTACVTMDSSGPDFVMSEEEIATAYVAPTFGNCDAVHGGCPHVIRYRGTDASCSYSDSSNLLAVCRADNVDIHRDPYSCTFEMRRDYVTGGWRYHSQDMSCSRPTDLVPFATFFSLIENAPEDAFDLISRRIRCNAIWPDLNGAIEAADENRQQELMAERQQLRCESYRTEQADLLSKYRTQPDVEDVIRHTSHWRGWGPPGAERASPPERQ